MILIPLFIVVPLLFAFMMPITALTAKRPCGLFAVTASLILLVISIAAISEVRPDNVLVYNTGSHQAPFGILLVLDGLSSMFLLIISAVASLVAVYSLGYMNRFTERSKFYTLFMLMVAGLNAAVLTGDLFNLYAAVEIAAISSYALVAFGTRDEEVEASFKYMIIGSVASAFILLATVLIYSSCGSLNMAYVSKMMLLKGMDPILYLSLSLYMAGFGIKSALVPFHAWLPDAHTSAPAPISAMLSGVLIKSVGVYAMMRLVFNVFGLTSMLSWILMIVGVMSMVVGALAAIGQWDYKRLLAYSSISQIGYIVFGLGLGTPLGILGGLFHLFNHATFKPLLFLNAGAVEHQTGTRDMRALGGLRSRMPVTFVTSIIGSMSISGVPPFNGFWSKLLIIFAGIISGHYAMSFIAILVSIITLAYFLKIEKNVYFGAARAMLKDVKETHWTMILAMSAFAFICVAVGFTFPIVIDVILAPAADVLLKGLKYSTAMIGG